MSLGDIAFFLSLCYSKKKEKGNNNMKIIPIGSVETVMSNFGSRHNYFGWPTVTRLKNGRLASVSSGYRLEHVCPFGKTVISFSEDEGNTWTCPAPVIDTVLDDRDGGIMTFGKSGVIVTSFNNTIAFQRNYCQYTPGTAAYRQAYLDLLTSEEETRDIGSTFKISYDNGITFSKLYKSPVTSPHGPCELDDGTVLWVGALYGSKDGLEKKGCSVQAWSINTDNGEMTKVGDIPEVTEQGSAFPCEPHAIYLGNGRLVCHIRVCGAGIDGSNVFTTYQSVSEDYGRTWSQPKMLLSIEGGAPAHLMKHSSGALISVYGYRLAPFGVKAMFSYDDGETWDTDYDVYVNGVNLDLGYPSSVELDDGSILTVFYAHENSGSPATVLQQRWTFEK